MPYCAETALCTPWFLGKSFWQAESTSSNPSGAGDRDGSGWTWSDSAPPTQGWGSRGQGWCRLAQPRCYLSVSCWQDFGCWWIAWQLAHVLILTSYGAECRECERRYRQRLTQMNACPILEFQCKTSLSIHFPPASASPTPCYLGSPVNRRIGSELGSTKQSCEKGKYNTIASYFFLPSPASKPGLAVRNAPNE